MITFSTKCTLLFRRPVSSCYVIRKKPNDGFALKFYACAFN